VGKALPCPECGVKFLVTPLPVAAYVPPPPDPILDAAPRPPPTRTLDPKVYPRMQWLPDDVPWGVIATIAGVALVGLVLYVGGRYAYEAVQRAIPPRKSLPVVVDDQPESIEWIPAESTTTEPSPADDGVVPSIASEQAASDPVTAIRSVAQKTIAEFEQEFGRERLLIVTAQGGNAQQRKALENEIADLVRPSRRAMHGRNEAMLIVLPYEGDVQDVAEQIRTAKVLDTDAALRDILVGFE
jgi:hypothetical protein